MELKNSNSFEPIADSHSTTKLLTNTNKRECTETETSALSPPNKRARRKPVKYSSPLEVSIPSIMRALRRQEKDSVQKHSETPFSPRASKSMPKKIGASTNFRKKIKIKMSENTLSLDCGSKEQTNPRKYKTTKEPKPLTEPKLGKQSRPLKESKLSKEPKPPKQPKPPKEPKPPKAAKPPKEPKPKKEPKLSKATKSKEFRIAEKFECSMCKKTFQGKMTLEVHMRTHTGERPFQCSVCKETFVRQGHLTRHRVVKHSTSKKFPCPFCNAVMLYQESLEWHLETCKKNTKRFEKPTASTIFSSNLNTAPIITAKKTAVASKEPVNNTNDAQTSVRYLNILSKMIEESNIKVIEENSISNSTDDGGNRKVNESNQSSSAPLFLPVLTSSFFTHQHNSYNHSCVNSLGSSSDHIRNPCICQICFSRFATTTLLISHKCAPEKFDFSCRKCRQTFFDSLPEAHSTHCGTSTYQGIYTEIGKYNSM